MTRHSKSYAADDRKLFVLRRLRPSLPAVAGARETWMGAYFGVVRKSEGQVRSNC